jgi:hypothetical protein
MSRKADVAEVAVVAGRPYWRAADARVVVEAWRRSGEPLSRFAKRHGVDLRRIARWASRLGGSGLGAVQFHPVRVTPEASQSWGSSSSIEIQLVGGRCVRVARGFAADDLRRVLAVLEEGARC